MSASSQIKTLNVREALAQIDSGIINASEVYLITLSEKLKNEFESRGANYIKSLGPSPRLWSAVQDMKNEGTWNVSRFNTYYRNEYLTSLMDRPSSLASVNLLASKYLRGENIYLVCFCQNPDICHRTILEELLIKMTSTDIINK